MDNRSEGGYLIPKAVMGDLKELFGRPITYRRVVNASWAKAEEPPSKILPWDAVTLTWQRGRISTVENVIVDHGYAGSNPVDPAKFIIDPIAARKYQAEYEKLILNARISELTRKNKALLEENERMERYYNGLLVEYNTGQERIRILLNEGRELLAKLAEYEKVTIAEPINKGRKISL